MQEDQNPDTGCPFEEDVLLAYLNGHVDAALKAAIERSPVCQQAAAVLQADLVEWQPSLRAMVCPDYEELVAYQERRLNGTAELLVHNHVQRCPFCRTEIAMLTAMDEVPLAPSTLARRLYALIFQPATLSPVPVLGEGSYRTIARTPQIELLVRTMRTAGRQGQWMVIGKLRYAGDQPVPQVESIVLQDLEDPAAPAWSTTIDDKGSFTLKAIEAGMYRLHILMATEELILHEFKIGEVL